MTKEDFIAKFADILQTDEEITLDTNLEDLEDWDSLTKMACVSWFLENKIQIKVAEVSTFKTVSEIAERLGVK